MFRRRKARIAPLQVDDYVRRRYEDLAVCIAQDLASNKGLFCYYTPWLDYMMSKFDLPGDYRMNHSLVARDPQGRHIGCSGAVKNTLDYYNPVSSDHHDGQVQFEEAVQKSRLSAKLRGISRRTSKEGKCGTETSIICSEAQDDDVGGDETFNSSVNVQKNVCDVVVIEVKPAEDILFDSEPCPMVQTNARTHQGKEQEQPQYVTEDGVVHVGGELGPQSEDMDSYYARIDEAFRKHRDEMSKPSDSGDFNNLRRAPHGSNSSPVKVHSRGGHRETAGSKFCTIL